MLKSRFIAAPLALLAFACGGEQTPEPQTAMQPAPEPMAEPMTPAAGAGEMAPMEAEPTTPPEPVTPPAPDVKPLVLNYGQTAHEIADVLLVKDAKAKKHKLLFLNQDRSCEDVWEAKNKTPDATVLATDVTLDENNVIGQAKGAKWTYYEAGKPTAIQPKADDVSLTTESVNDKTMGTLRIKATVKTFELSGEGPFEIEVCEPPSKT